MTARLLMLFALSAVLLMPTSKKSVATAKGENEDLALTATLYIDPTDLKEMIGSDLGGHYIVADVRVEPKYGKEVLIDRDDFQLRTDRDGEKAKPFAASQIAGQGGLVIKQVTDNTGVGSPGWTGATGPVIMGGGGGGIGAGKGDVDASQPKVTVEADAKANPLKKVLDGKILPEKKTDKAVTGLLFFPMEKQKMKDLELTYGGKENRITLRFKP
jgi:hypothetical protein